MNVKMSTIIRTACLLLALINQGLTLAGKSPLPIEDAQLTELLSLVFTTGAALWAWWKNNSFTQAAITADEIMHDIKVGNVEYIDDTEE